VSSFGLTDGSIPIYSVNELNQAISKLLSRGFAPNFILQATISRAQLKNGHLWLTLTDGKSSINSVIWSSTLKKCSFSPSEEDGVEILGKLNFWENKASLVVQVISIKPSISTVLRKFELVRDLLIKDGLISEDRRRSLPHYPIAIAILTSVPSSAFADILRTAKERWPLTKLIIFPIPVQGEVANKIQNTLKKLTNSITKLKINAIVLARGGGSREDLMVFDNESLCRELANFPIPVVTGLGHEDDMTVADLVADHRAATPTAAIVDLLPSREIAKGNFLQYRQRLRDYSTWVMNNKKQLLSERVKRWNDYSPFQYIKCLRDKLVQKDQLLQTLSPEKLLMRGFCIVANHSGKPIRSIHDVNIKELIDIQLTDGYIKSKVENISSKENT